MKDVIFIKINKLYRNDMSSDELYESTRGIWKVDINKVKHIKYAFSLYNGTIKEIYKIDSWIKPTNNYKNRVIDLNDAKLKGRWEFIGKIALDDIRNCFIEQDISKYYKKGEANPIKYMDLEVLKQDLCSKIIYPDDLEDTNLYEGLKKQIIVNAYERNQQAREECINYYGYKCQICNFDFEKVYGEIGNFFIHVHHIVDISTIGKNYQIDPIKDLIPVCPNCHAMLHKEKPAILPDKLKEILLQK